MGGKIKPNKSIKNVLGLVKGEIFQNTGKSISNLTYINRVRNNYSKPLKMS